MFHQKHISQLERTHPISFVRDYILDNIFVCMLSFLALFASLWYANKAMKRIEQVNRELLLVAEKNRSKLDEVIALKNKRSEFEEVVVKAKEAQKAAKKHVDEEMKKLNMELLSTTNKISDLEKIVNKIFFSGSCGKKNASSHEKESSQVAKMNIQTDLRIRRTRSKIVSRYSNLRSRRRSRLSLHQESTGRLLDGHPGGDLHPLNRKFPLLRRNSSYSSNIASAETSSTETSYCPPERILSKFNYPYEGYKRKVELKRYLKKKTTSKMSSPGKEMSLEDCKTITPLTRTVFSLMPILLGKE